jgi:hypothetical protein
MYMMELFLTPAEAIGIAPAKVCKSSKPDSELPASWLASCKARGLRARSGEKSHKIGSKRVKVAGKKIKSVKYGGPLKDYS